MDPAKHLIIEIENYLCAAVFLWIISKAITAGGNDEDPPGAAT
jgi:hypothetical protein